jgi:putative endonuclease
MHERALLGRAGEDLAARMYLDDGFEVARNYRCSYGEMDVIASRPGLVVFCEVKTRSTSFFGLPAEAVGHAKQARLRRIAAHWLAEHRPGRVEIRFDVVSVIVTDQGTELTHIPSAF